MIWLKDFFKLLFKLLNSQLFNQSTTTTNDLQTDKNEKSQYNKFSLLPLNTYL